MTAATVPSSPKNHKSGLFVAFEGLEGCGKSTQLGLLARALKKSGHGVTATREPGGTVLGRQLRRVLLHDETQHPGPEEEFLMFLLDRQAHLRQVITPALGRGEVVLCDRYHYSTLAYQRVGGRPLPPEWESFSWRMIGHRRPDLVILLDIAPVQAFARLAHRGKDKIERRGEAYFRQVRRRFLQLAGEDPGRFLVLQAQQPAQTLHQQILDEVLGRLPIPHNKKVTPRSRR